MQVFPTAVCFHCHGHDEYSGSISQNSSSSSGFYSSSALSSILFLRPYSSCCSSLIHDWELWELTTELLIFSISTRFLAMCFLEISFMNPIFIPFPLLFLPPFIPVVYIFSQSEALVWISALIISLFLQNKKLLWSRLKAVLVYG